MSLKLEFELSMAEKERMTRIPPQAWFTQVVWRNATSPWHPDATDLDTNHDFKRHLVLPWITECVKGKRVLDLFCANGAFSFEASLAGAKEVVGMEFSPDRVECAQFIASTFTGKTNCCAPSFVTGNVYDLARIFTGPFDVVLALGGLYHIADPPYVLTQIRSLTRERLIVQTHNVLNKRGNWGAFLIRQDKTARGLTSIVGGRGVWHFSVGCFESILHHADFRILESRRPSLFKRRRFPWYCASAEPI